MSEEDEFWRFDAMTQFMKSPDWAVPVWGFIDENCIVFDSDEESKLAHMDIFNAFREMVEALLHDHLSSMGISEEEFAQMCARQAGTEVGREILEQILAVDDFVSFKTMMTKRNTDLEMEAMVQLQALSEKIENGIPDEPTDEPEDDFEAQMQAALEASLKEVSGEGIATGIHPDDLSRQQAEQEDADLKFALALSMQVAEAESEPPPAPPPRPPPPPPPPPPPAAQERSALPAIKGRGAGWQPPQPATLQTVSRASEEAAHAREQLLQAKEQAAPPPMQSHVPSEKEKAARIEHLKRQRDLILAQRKKQREVEAAAVPPPPPPPASAGYGAQADAMSRAAGYSAEPQSDAHRAQMTRSLASALKAELDPGQFSDPGASKADRDRAVAQLIKDRDNFR